MNNAPFIAVSIPCYRVEPQIGQVLADMPPIVTRIYCVDDKSPDNSAAVIEAAMGKDSRIRLIRHEKNQGEGGATMSGYRAALADGADIVVKVDGDGQMDPNLIPGLIAPILAGEADYVKGNRFYNIEGVRSMPRMRLFGNIILSFMNKLSSGYYHIFDTTNGFTAIHARILAEIPLDKVHRRFFFVSDIMFRLYLARAVVKEFVMDAKYGDESSNLKISKVMGPIFFGHARNSIKRFFYSYFLRDFNQVSVGILLGLPLLVFGILFGGYEFIMSLANDKSATAGNVMFGALPIILGTQLLLAAWQMDIANVPQEVRHKYLQKRDQNHKKKLAQDQRQNEIVS